MWTRLGFNSHSRQRWLRSASKLKKPGTPLPKPPFPSVRHLLNHSCRCRCWCRCRCCLPSISPRHKASRPPLPAALYPFEAVKVAAKAGDILLSTTQDGPGCRSWTTRWRCWQVDMHVEQEERYIESGGLRVWHRQAPVGDFLGLFRLLRPLNTSIFFFFIYWPVKTHLSVGPFLDD